MEPSTEQSSPAIPIAIISGFAMIALAIFFTNGKDDQANLEPIEQNTETEITTTGEPRPIDETDYIRGNPNAPILMVEYSDYDCPFCKQYHETMIRIMDEYGITGKVAWVYRQFPLGKLHPNSPKISEAALCVGEIGGKDAFWKFSDKIFSERNLEDSTNVTKLPEYAEAAGITKSAYVSCMDEGRMEPKVISSIEDGFNSGARGTPYTVIIVGDQQAVINGAQPFEVVRGIVENLVEQLNGTFDSASTSSNQTVEPTPTE